MSAPLHLILGTLLIAVAPADAGKPSPGVESRWEGFVRHDFRVDGANVIVVEPKQPLSGAPGLGGASSSGHSPMPTSNCSSGLAPGLSRSAPTSSVTKGDEALGEVLRRAG